MQSEEISCSALVDADACAAAIGLPKATFYKMVKAKLIPAYRVGVKGRGLRVSIPEVLAALRAEKE